MAYEFLRTGGYVIPKTATDREATHLFLDGGKAAVPDDVNGTFLNAYAAGVVRSPHQRPCIVELRTPVFRMFMDMDACWPEAPTAGSSGDPCAAVAAARAVLLHVARVARETFEEPAADVMEVCVASECKTTREGWSKQGFHVVWPDVYVTAVTALAFRDKLLEGPLPDPWPFANDPDKVFDACVFKSAGLRMPWSNKGRGDSSHYVPRASVVWTPAADDSDDDAEDFVITHHAEPGGVSDIRDHMSRLCIRAFGKEETRVAPDLHRRIADAAAAAADGGGAGSSKAPNCANLARYGHVLPALDDALPVQYAGQRFTGLVEGENCFMLRSTSRWCGNLGREHRTNNVYFVLTRKGIHQRCYCRCETTDGRAYGMCKDYSGPTHAVSQEVVHAFFGAGNADDTDDAAEKKKLPAGAAPAAVRPHMALQSKKNMGLSAILKRRIETKKPRRGKKHT